MVLYNTSVMIDVFLLPEASVVTSNGDSAAVDISGAEHRIFLVNLSIAAVIEQQAVELSVFTSADGATWETKPLAGLPQKFYVGEYPLLIDLSRNPEVRFLRAHWDVNRWGRGTNTPRFDMSVRLREIPPAFLSKATERAGAAS